MPGKNFKLSGHSNYPNMHPQRAEAEHQLCRVSTEPMVQSVISRAPGPAAVIASCRTLASAARTERRAQQQSVLTSIKPSLPDQQRLLVEVAGDGGVSTWLGTTPTVLTPSSIFNKNDFRNALCLRYGLALGSVPSSCVCGRDMTTHHAFTCPSGGYPTQRHNQLRDLFGDTLAEVVCDVESEPPLAPLQGEAVSGNTADGARVDVRACGFWSRQQNAFFDVRVTHPRPSLLSRSQVMSQLADHERQKKRQYADRINRVDRGSFTPLVFATNGMCSTETTVFLRTLAARIHDRHRDLPYSLLVRQLRSRISLCLVRWQITCLRGAVRRTSRDMLVAALIASPWSAEPMLIF